MGGSRSRRTMTFLREPELLRPFARELLRVIDKSVLWTALPEIYIVLEKSELLGLPRDSTRALIRQAVKSILGWHHVSYALVDEVLYIATTSNQSRVLEAISGRTIKAERMSLGRAAAQAELERHRTVHRAKRARVDDVSALKVEASAVVLGWGARALQASKGAISQLAPKCVVAATQHSAIIRSFLLNAERFGIPTVYFPHAPVARNLAYADLPFTAAGLRGQAEVELYASWGAAPEKLHTVGVPSQDSYQAATATLGHPILALSPWSQDVVRKVFNFVGKALAGPVCVAPHPRTSQDVLTGLPSGWYLNPYKSTQELLSKRQAPVVIQASSGVAWEAVAMGHPVIQLDIPEIGRNYPFITEPYVRCVSNPQELSNAITTIPDWHSRTEAMNHADRWGSPVGEAARQNARQVITEVKMSSASPLAMDYWATWLSRDSNS